ncbi:ABC transporter substrate-binding protein [Sulfitobacter sp. M220]
MIGQRALRVLAAAIACGAMPAVPAKVYAQDLPRVVSMNLCTDQMVLLLADPEQIVSLSRLARDPRSSSLAQEAEAYPQNAGGAEEIYLSDPDLVLAGRYSDKATLAMLRHLGLQVAQMPLTKKLDDIPAQIRQMGNLLRQPTRADTMARQVEQTLAAQPALTPDAPVAAFYYPNGYSLGVDTLGHDIVTTGGLRNLSQKLGRQNSGRLALEELVMNAPDLLVTTQPYRGGSRSEEIMLHPALAQYAQTDRMVYSSPDWVCGTPLALRAVQDVRRARNNIRHEEK